MLSFNNKSNKSKYNGLVMNEKAGELFIYQNRF